MSKSLWVSVEFQGLAQKRPGDYGAKLTVDGVVVRDKYMAEFGFGDPGEDPRSDFIDYSIWGISGQSATNPGFVSLKYETEPSSDGKPSIWSYSKWTRISVSDDYVIPWQIDKTGLKEAGYTGPSKTSFGFEGVKFDFSTDTVGGLSFANFSMNTKDNFFSVAQNAAAAAGLSNWATAIGNAGVVRGTLENILGGGVSLVEAGFKGIDDPNFNVAAFDRQVDAYLRNSHDAATQALVDTTMFPNNPAAEAVADQLLGGVRMIGIAQRDGSIPISAGIQFGLQVSVGGATLSSSVTGTVHADLVIDGSTASVIDGGAGDDRLIGGPGDDVIIDGADDDYSHGGSGNDRFENGAGMDFINGGAGHDIAKFAASSSVHSWSVVGNKTRVQGADGTDTLTGVEVMQFTDASYKYQTGFDAVSHSSKSFGASVSAGGWADNRNYPREVADISGDGNADLIGYGSGGVYAALTSASGSSGATYLALNSFGADPAAGGWVDSRVYPRTLGDINGDGNADLVGFGSAGVYASLNLGGGQFGPVYFAKDTFGASPEAEGWTDALTFPRMLADINGDDMDDIVGFGGAGAYAALAIGAGQFGEVFLASNSFGVSASAGGWSDNDRYTRMLSDINGDGRADILGFGNAGTFAALARADGTFGTMFLVYSGFGSSIAAGGWTSNDRYYRTVGDMDGDGYADLVGFADAGVFVSRGDGEGHFGQGQLALNAFGTSAAAGGWASQNVFPRMIADMDGNGMDDVAGFGNAGVFTAQSSSDWLLI